MHSPNRIDQPTPCKEPKVPPETSIVDIPEKTPPEVQTSTASQRELPESFIRFLKDNGIPHDFYDTCGAIPRYFRTARRLPSDNIESIRIELKLKFDAPMEKVPHVPDFWRTAPHVKLSHLEAYAQGYIYGLDITSGLAVLALDLEENDQVLDLCCAPGAKLCMISDLLGTDGRGTVTGVDISPQRIATCRALVKKYRHWNARLYCGDGTTFTLRAPLATWKDPTKGRDATISEPTSLPTKPFYAPRLLRHEASRLGWELYDKYDTWGWEKFEKQFMNPERINTITDLQRRLITNGWNLLKPGGLLVYSTCSLTRAQNEGVVTWFLEHHPEAIVEPVPFVKEMLGEDVKYCRGDLVKEAIRFHPDITQTSGFFLVRVRICLPVMSCDLSDSNILQAYTEIVNGQGTNWLLLGYNDTRDIISLYGKGSGGLGEFVTHLRSEVLFGFLRFDNTNILIQHISEQVSGVRRARGLVHGRAVANLLKDHDQQIIVSSAGDLREDTLRSRIKSSNTDEAGDNETMTDDAPRATSPKPTVSSPTFSPTSSSPTTGSHLQPPAQPSYSGVVDAPVAPLPSAEAEAESRKPRGMQVQQSPLEPIPAESTPQTGSGSLAPSTSSSPGPSISNISTATNGHHL
ncbi:hypothetical protein IWQ62_003135, partial [Dispira parvispora]